MGSCRSFRLLLWKDLRVILSNPTEFLLVVLSSFFIPLLLSIIMGIISYDMNIKEAKIFPAKSVETNLYDELYFSPYNNLIEGFFRDFANITKFNESSGFIDIHKLEVGLAENDRALGVAFPDDWFTFNEFPEDLKLFIYMPGYKNHKDFDYFESGFLYVQKTLINLFAQRVKNSSNTYLPNVKMKHLPYPRHKNNSYAEVACTMPIIILASFFLPTVTLTKHIVAEKENQEKSLLNAVGLGNCLLWLAWYTKALILFLTCLVLFLIFVAFSNVYAFSNYFILIILFIVYIHSCITFAFLISSFCSKTYWGILATIVLFVASVVPYALVPPMSVQLMPQIFCCFCLNSAMFYIFNVVCGLEQMSIGLNWNTFIATIVPEDISILGVLAIMLITSLICMFLSLYVEQLMPGTHSWSFPCPSCKKSLRSFPALPVLSSDTARKVLDFCVKSLSFCIRRPAAADADDRCMGGQNHKDDEPAIHLDRVTKEFNKKTVVSKLSIKMYKDECLTLLGPSGAGKTTTLRMLAGIEKPTSGIAKINGYDIVRNPDRARSGIGFCPQQNVLFSGLTVNQQISFFSLLRGKKASAANRETSSYIEKLNLQEYENTKVSNLSKGNQRRVSLACSLVGGSTVVLCDEPSSGLDPVGKQQVMELLQNEKKGRTIVLATKDLDEGQMLGDRIFILSEGHVCSQGSMESIKMNNYETYKLSCQKGPNCQDSKVTDLVKSYVQTAKALIQGASISYTIRGNFVDKFVEMLRQLEEHKKNLDIISFSWRDATLENVFKTEAGPRKKRARAGGNIPKRSTEDLATQTDSPDRQTRRAQRAQRAAEAAAAAAEAERLAREAAAREAREGPTRDQGTGRERETGKEKKAREKEARDREAREREARETEERERQAREKEARDREDRERQDRERAAREKRDKETDAAERKPPQKLEADTDHEGESDTSEREWRTNPEGGKRNRTCCKVIEAMVMKKALYIWSHKFMFLLIVIIPIIWFLIVNYVGPPNNKNQHGTDLADWIHIRLESFPEDVIVLLEDPNGHEAEAVEYADQVKKPAVLEEIKSSVESYLITYKPHLMEKLKRQYVCGASFDENSGVTAWYNDLSFEHSSALSMVLIYRAILKVVIGKRFDISLIRGILKKSAKKYARTQYRQSLNQTRHQRDVFDNLGLIIPSKSGLRSEQDIFLAEGPNYPAFKQPHKFAQSEILSDYKLNGKRLTITIAVSAYIALVLSIFILFVVEERVKKLQLQQEIQGLGKFHFWFTHFVWDFLVLCLCMTLSALALDYITHFVQILIILIMIGFACLPFTYVLSLIFKSPEAALVGAFFIHLFTGGILFAFIYVVTALLNNSLYLVIFPTLIGCFGIFKAIYGHKYCETQAASASLKCGFGRIHPRCGCDGSIAFVA
ncbi:ATP-binding cassette sub-family A member 2 isoform X2 [Drosophila bipectinata]|uniref:ATP-binding cassette sub-family A member 2 isoform X2 n=1 Tax=Drosophila bipectinata TaxID=42026 RepID=UPI0038B336B0